MIKIVLNDGKIIYSEKTLQEVFSHLFYRGQVNLENGYAITASAYAYIEQLPSKQEEKIRKEFE